MHFLEIARKTGVYGWANKMNIFFNGVQIGKIRNNKTIELEIPSEEGELQVAFWGNEPSEVLFVKAGQKILISSNSPSMFTLFRNTTKYMLQTKIVVTVLD